MALSAHLRQDFFDEIAVIRQTRHFVLTAQLAFGAQPIVECTIGHYLDAEGQHGEVAEALGFVVGVDALQVEVEQACEGLKISGFFGKFNDPLVAALSVALKIDGGHGVFAHLCTSEEARCV